MKSYEHPDVLGAQRILRPNSTDLALSALVSGDAYSRWTLDAAGKMSWGPGNAATDVTLERYWDGANAWLKASPRFTVGDLAITTLNVGNNALSINVSGQVTAGTWLGSAVGALYGGTGQTGVTTGDLLYGSATNTWNRRAATTNGYVLTLSGGIPVWAGPGALTLLQCKVSNIWTVDQAGAQTIDVGLDGVIFTISCSDCSNTILIDQIRGGLYDGGLVDGRIIYLVDNLWATSHYAGVVVNSSRGSLTDAWRIRYHLGQNEDGNDNLIVLGGAKGFYYDAIRHRWLTLEWNGIS
jgi:hypothetical protein